MMNFGKFSWANYRANYAYAKKMAERKNGFGGPLSKKFQWGDIFTFISFILIVNQRSLPDNWPAEYIYIASAVIYMIGQMLYFIKLPPRSRWGRLSWGLVLGAFAWTIIPLILYWCEDTATRDLQSNLVTSGLSIIMWLMAAFSLFKYRQVRRRAADQIYNIRMQSRRRRMYQ